MRFIRFVALFSLALGVYAPAALAVPAANLPASPDTSGRTWTAPASTLPESSSPWSASWGLTLASRYLFLGADASYGHAVLQPELTVAYRGLSVTAWANHDLKRSESNELDLLLDYGMERGPASFSLGYGHFRYPHRYDCDPTQEVIASASVSSFLDLSGDLHYDFDGGKGIYSTFGLGKELELPYAAVSLESDLLYQSGYFDMTGIPALGFQAGISRDFGSFSVSPSIGYYTTWENGDFRGESALPSRWLFSFGISQSF